MIKSSLATLFIDRRIRSLIIRIVRQQLLTKLFFNLSSSVVTGLYLSRIESFVTQRKRNNLFGKLRRRTAARPARQAAQLTAKAVKILDNLVTRNTLAQGSAYTSFLRLYLDHILVYDKITYQLRRGILYRSLVAKNMLLLVHLRIHDSFLFYQDKYVNAGALRGNVGLRALHRIDLRELLIRALLFSNLRRLYLITAVTLRRNLVLHFGLYIFRLSVRLDRFVRRRLHPSYLVLYVLTRSVRLLLRLNLERPVLRVGVGGTLRFGVGHTLQGRFAVCFGHGHTGLYFFRPMFWRETHKRSHTLGHLPFCRP